MFPPECVLLCARAFVCNCQHARELAEFLLPLHDVTRDVEKPQRKRTGLLVNLIPFNEGASAGGAGDAGGLNGFKRPSQDIVKLFQVCVLRPCVRVRVRARARERKREGDGASACR